MDGLRGIAILLVILFHCCPPLALFPRWARVLPVLSATGWCGVDLFFVLSGFLITGILLEAKGTKGYFRNFYVRRTLRIFPLYYGTLLVLFLAARAGGTGGFAGREPGLGWFLSYGMNVWVVLHGHFPTSLGHFWSLAVEEHFYLLWPALVLWTGRRGLVLICGGCLAGALVLRSALVLRGCPPTAVYVATPCRIDTLALGALLALAVRQPVVTGRLRKWAKIVIGVGTGALLVVLAWRHIVYDFDPVVQSVGFTASAFFWGAALVLAVLPVTPGSASIWQRVLRLPALRGVGKLSYGLYVYFLIVQQSLLGYFGRGRLAGRIESNLGYALAFASVTVALSFAGAWASWHLFEKRFLRLKRFFEYRSPTPGLVSRRMPLEVGVPEQPRPVCGPNPRPALVSQ